jgi:hypothetical protein
MVRRRGQCSIAKITGVFCRSRVEAVAAEKAGTPSLGEATAARKIIVINLSVELS